MLLVACACTSQQSLVRLVACSLWKPILWVPNPAWTWDPWLSCSCPNQSIQEAASSCTQCLSQCLTHGALPVGPLQHGRRWCCCWHGALLTVMELLSVVLAVVHVLLVVLW